MYGSAFEDMYCFCLRLLDRLFVQMDADYADFNTVLAALRSRLVDALAQRRLSFREFKRLIAVSARGSHSDRLRHPVPSQSPLTAWHRLLLLR